MIKMKNFITVMDNNKGNYIEYLIKIEHIKNVIFNKIDNDNYQITVSCDEGIYNYICKDIVFLEIKRKYKEVLCF